MKPLRLMNSVKDMALLNRLRFNGLPSKSLIYDNIQYFASHQHKLAHKPSSLFGRTQRWFPSSMLFGVNSNYYPGIKSQQVNNLCDFYIDMFKYSYEKYQKDRTKLDTSNELFTKVSPVEFTGHPSMRDNAFTTAEGSDILAKISEKIEQATDKTDKNFNFMLTLPIVYNVSISTGMQEVFHNSYFSFGRGIGDTFATCLSSPSESQLKIMSFNKVNPSNIDIIHSGIHTMPSHGNTPVYSAITNSGNIILLANEICLDNRMGVTMGKFDVTGLDHDKGQFEQYLSSLVQSSPYAFMEWAKNPLVHHDVLSSSVIVNTSNIVSSIYSHTDSKAMFNHQYMRGIYSLGSDIPFPGREKRFNSVGGRLIIRSNEKIPGDQLSLSPAGMEILRRVEKDNQLVLDDARKNKAVAISVSGPLMIQQEDKPQGMTFKK